ncbi:hypothetical protein KM043_015711 [Ampulex compressa]|nr:hypothetical protein KM043_015711 [Ampulex compressa]
MLHRTVAREIRSISYASWMSNRSVLPTKASTSAVMTNDLDIAKCFELAKELTVEAGKVMTCSCEGEKEVELKENQWDFVTNYDHKVEELIISGLSVKYPDHKFIAEESASEQKEATKLTDAPTWILDPIDGTTNFIHSFPCSCISLGLAIQQELVLGIIYNPWNSELYTARKGEGAFLNGKRIRSSRVVELKNALIALEPCTIRFCSKNRDIRLGRFEAIVGISHGIRSLGSAALSMAYVAKGAIDCFHMDFLQPWDVAAGTLIVREAGGAVIDTKGGQYDFMKPNTIAAANDVLAREMSKFIVDTDLKTQRKRLQRT